MHRPFVHKVGAAWRFVEEISFLLSQTYQGASQKVDQKLNMAYPLYSGGQAIGKACESVLPQDWWQRMSKQSSVYGNVQRR
jgi:hypothetical protein